MLAQFSLQILKQSDFELFAEIFLGNIESESLKKVLETIPIQKLSRTLSFPKR
jgi:hypothetical protein